MKHKITRKIFLDLLVDSSEAIMFMKGGKHNISLDIVELIDPFDLKKNDILLDVSIQIDKEQKNRFDFITSEAMRHKDRENET